MSAVKTAAVPCNGCTACCRRDMIFLHPECGDDPKQYFTTEAVNPLTGEKALMLARGASGDCIYLGAGGCTIHGRAPAICREFDCRRLVKALLDRGGLPGIKRRIDAGHVSRQVVRAGRERMHTLEKTDG